MMTEGDSSESRLEGSKRAILGGCHPWEGFSCGRGKQWMKRELQQLLWSTGEDLWPPGEGQSPPNHHQWEGTRGANTSMVHHF